MSPLLEGLVVLVVYLLVVKILRWRRLRALERRFRIAPGSMSPIDAQKIMRVSYEFDMPGLMGFALAFALFKTYGIPSISRLLLSTRQLSTADHGAKRYVDTGVLVYTWLACPLSDPDRRWDEPDSDVDPRSAIAIARVNWLHHKYDISNDDYLYTLSLFTLEPIRWARKFGWRELSPIEEEAHYVFWAEIGRRMHIHDIPESLSDLENWSTKYEEDYMIPDIANRDVTGFTMFHFLRRFTQRFGLRSFLNEIAICLLEERTRIAMIQPAQSALMHATAHLLLRYFAFKQRYLSLPRWKPHLYVLLDIPKKDLKEPLPRMRPTVYGKEPWYKKEPTGAAFLVQLFKTAVGLVETKYLPGPKYKSQGYRLEELGPMAFENSGHAEVMRAAGDILGCPIKGPWAR